MNSGTGAFLVKFEAVLDIVVDNRKIEFILLSMVQFGYKQSFDEERKPHIGIFLIPGHDKVVAIAGGVASDAAGIAILLLEGYPLSVKIGHHFTTG